MSGLPRRTCDACPSGTASVQGEGPIGAPVMILGEAPGETEVREGRPFLGKAGRNLDAILSWIPVTRANFRITNVVMCRPKRFGADPISSKHVGNVHPSAHAVRACARGLDEEIASIAPGAILAFGVTAASRLYGRPVAIRDVHGRESWYTVADHHVPFVATYHPSPLSINREPGRAAAIRTALERCVALGADRQRGLGRI